MGFNCDHGVYLGEGCDYCVIQSDHRKSSGTYGIRVGINVCLEILKDAASVQEAIDKIKQLKPETMYSW